MKKARHMSLWESILVDEDCSPRLGLEQLFGASPRSRRRNENFVSNFFYDQAPRQYHRLFLNEQDNGFFTLRLEHRVGGAMAQHRGEERILLFRSDRPGAIAKIIYSSIPAPALPRSATSTDQESDLRSMTQARIHVLDVREPYRGYDLGGLLFSEAISSLRHRYMDYEDEQHTFYSYFIRCQLDAEEDVRRHNKLVRFYENLGCSIKPNSAVQYLNNNDGETYRKIPMQMALRGLSDTSLPASDRSIVDSRGVFLPVQLLDISGSSIHVPRRDGKDACRLDWLLVDDGEGNIQFRTTHGLYLTAYPDGRCSAAAITDDEEQDGDTPPEYWANFRLYRVSDSDEFDEDSEIDARQKELWLLKTAHGTFLTGLSVERSMYCSKAPEFWQADADTLSLICTSDTPPRRQHYRKTWVKQTVDYVQRMHERYLNFQLGEMSIRNALNLVKATPYQRFHVARNPSDPGPSLRTLCVSSGSLENMLVSIRHSPVCHFMLRQFKLAEASRIAGHPDWVQLVALV